MYLKRLIMTRSRHFAQSRRSTRSSLKNNANSGTFDSEIKKFDDEIKSIAIKNEDDDHNGKTVESEEVEPKQEEKIPHMRKPKRTSIKHIKLEIENEINDASSPSIPDNFFPIYNKIKEMRKLITTPVDLVGCIKIPTLLQFITKQFRETGEMKVIEVSEIPGLKDQLLAFEKTFDFDKIWRYQLLTTLLFSSQTKDEINFKVMQSLHIHYLSNGYKDGLCIDAILNTPDKELEKMIFKIGFYSRKAMFLKETTQSLHDVYSDDIPRSIDELVQLKGIGYKMGHLILQGAWNEVVGISVDTHMVRLCNMFGWLSKKDEKNPDNVRKELERFLIHHKDMWREINPVLVGFGQSVCTPTGRRCDLCLLSRINEKNDYLCPAVDKRLLLRVKRGVENEDRKLRGDLEKLIKYINE